MINHPLLKPKLKFSRRSILTIGGVLLTILGWSYLYQISRPPKTSLISSGNVQDQILTNPKIEIFYDSKFTLPYLDHPVNIYIAEIDSNTLEASGIGLANHLGLDQVENTNWLWQSPDKKKYLVINKLNKNLQYSIDRYESPTSYEGPNKPDVNNAIKIAKEFSQLIPNSPPLTAEINKINYLISGGTNFSSGSSNKFDYIEIKLSQLIDDFPIKINNSPDSTINVIVGQKNQIIKAVINPQWVNIGNKINSKNMLNKEQLTQVIRQGVITELGGYENIIEFKDLKFIKLMSADVEYRYSSESKKLTPHYEIQAEITTLNNKLSTAVISIPAVDISTP